jgi:parallel beta-helix repeat protein/predicted outer membrane repeat protein
MVDSEKSVTAVFVMLEYALTINENGLGTVSVTPNQSTYKYGDQVTLEAFPSTGWTFGEWTGELSGYSNPVSITVNDHMDITAVFVMSVQKAIDSAQDGDTIVIPPGTYYENIDFRGKSITLESEDPYDWDVVEATVLNGQLNGSVVSFASGEGAGTVLRGFTITNGSGRSLEGTLCGGGIFIGESSPTISNNLIMQNTASLGGGIYIRGDSAQPSLTGNIIRNNQGIGVLSDSGAQPTIVANEITGNSGQGIFSSQSHSIITGNTIAGNSAGVSLWNGGSATVAENEIKDNRGNGIYFAHWSSVLPVLIKDNTIVGNMRGIDAQSSRRTTITGNYIAGNDATRFRYSSDQDGGAIRFGSSSSNTLIVSDNTFEDNKARNGGAISMSGRTIMLQNNIIRNNEAQNGAGVYAISGSTLNLTGNTIEGNVAQNDGGGVYVSFTSSLSILTGNSITGNTPDEVYYE